MKTLQQILKEKSITFFQFDRFSLDNYYFESFQEVDENFDPNRVFETEPFRTSKKKIQLPVSPFSLFMYFLDGSRKPYKIGDIITTDNKFVPVVVGQVCAGCCYRDNDNKIKKYKTQNRNVLMLYDSIQDEDFNDIKIAFQESLKKKIPVDVERYTYNPQKDADPTIAAVSKIQRFMQDMEIALLTDMVHTRALDTDKMLVIDGSLQFLTQKFNSEIFYNVVGISKSFNPNLTGLMKSKVHIGTKLAELEFGERTPVFKTMDDKRRYTYGIWYLRIREQRNTRNPLEGVVKIEKMALNQDLDNGLDSCMVDNISASIIYERNPTCHGNDNRWANHLYPVYLTEKMIKSTFLSDTYFTNIF